MAHHHTYHTTAFWTLTLPDQDQYCEAFLSWACPCGEEVWSTGTFHETATAMSPEAWQQVMTLERRQRGALTEAARQEERVSVPLEVVTIARQGHAWPRRRYVGAAR